MMDKQKKAGLVSVIFLCLIAVFCVVRWVKVTQGGSTEETNQALFEIREGVENLGDPKDWASPTGQVVTGTPAPSGQAGMDLFDTDEVRFTPIDVVVEEGDALSDIIKLVKYGCEPVRSKWKTLERIKPYLMDDFYQWCTDYFLHLDMDKELPDFWPQDAGVYVYLYDDAGVPVDMVTIEVYIERFGKSPDEGDIAIVDGGRDPETVEVTYEETEDDNVVLVKLLDSVSGGTESMYIYFGPTGRVWYFY